MPSCRRSAARLVGHAMVLAALGLGGARAWGQPPGVDAKPVNAAPGSDSAPGAGGGPVDFGGSQSTEPGILSGRPGAGAPRGPSSATTPDGDGFRIAPGRGLGLPALAPITAVPLYGPLALPGRVDDDGPPGGMTLDEAIDRLVRSNLALQARKFDIQQADADILTASLRANPIVFADSQLVPYGSFNPQTRPGGQTQYDVNITYPVDVTRKRQARTEVARQARRVTEAQYQDAVRIQIDNVYTAYVDILAARETLRYARAAREGLEELNRITRIFREKGTRTIADEKRVQALLEAAEIGVIDSEETLRNSSRGLGRLLGIPPQVAEDLPIRGSLRDPGLPLPPFDELCNLAVSCRPDIVAYRLGVQRARADVTLAERSRYGDVYVLYQPYTFQDNRPTGGNGATSYALGLTAALPIYNRNQGNIQRARSNVIQSKVELGDQEQQVALDVRQAYGEYATSKQAIDRVERTLLPASERVRDDALKLFSQGEQDVVSYLNAQRDYNDVIRQYRDTAVRHRRSMLRLNTAVGRRVLP